MSETITEQLADIEEQAADTPATEYTPPEGWRVLAVGEQLKGGDEYHAGLGRYIRRTEPQPEPQAEPVQVREGRWRTRNGEIKNIRACEPLKGAYYVWPWTDGFMTYQDNGRNLAAESDNDLVEYLGPIEAEPEQVNDWPSVRDLRHELKTVQTQLGESRQRVTQLEELVASLRTINEAQEKAVEAAGKENTALQLQVQNRQQEYERQKGRIEFLETLNAGNGAAIGDYIAKVAKLQGLVDTARGQLEAAATEHDSLSTQLAAVKAELVTQAETSRKLRIELDAAQQVPQAVNDRFEEGWDAGTARAVETIAEWTEPFRTCGSQALALAVMANLPHIMRSLTGLTPED